MGAHGATPFIFDLGAPVLVGIDSWSARHNGLWRRCPLRLHHFDSQRPPRRTHHVRDTGLVSVLRWFDSVLGIDAARRPAARRVDYVDSGGTGLHHRRPRILRWMDA